MRKFTILCFLLLIVQHGYSQQWSGSSSQIGNINRSGNVGIGTSSTLNAKLTLQNTASSGQYLQMGNYFANENRRNINFGFDDSGSSLGFSMISNTDKERFVVRLENGLDPTYMVLRDFDEAEIFKASRDASLGSFVHMPKADSRLIIGGTGGYLFSEGHKLVVKNGSAKIEGNVISDGNIGIGTDLFVDGSDSYRLSVEGRVRATAVKVYTDWADFVFEEDYALPTLEEVESYINENGRLSEIPSAAEVEKNGIELGEMNKLLLQKIEELTLYTIQQNKQIEQLANEINKLKEASNDK